MNGYPKIIQTKHDVEVLLATHPIETKEFLSKLIDEVPQWVPAELIGDGMTDATHKVIEEKGFDDVIKKSQYELVENQQATLFRIGYTIREARVIAE